MDILIIEDSDDDFEITEIALNKSENKHNISRCVNGDEAIEFLFSSEQKADLILLDLNMPGIHGYEILEKIKTSKRKQVPVMVLTTSADEKEISRCYELGANAYLEKPVDLKSFYISMDIMQKFWSEVVKIPS